MANDKPFKKQMSFWPVRFKHESYCYSTNCKTRLLNYY